MFWTTVTARMVCIRRGRSLAASVELVSAFTPKATTTTPSNRRGVTEASNCVPYSTWMIGAARRTQATAIGVRSEIITTSPIS